MFLKTKFKSSSPSTVVENHSQKSYRKNSYFTFFLPDFWNVALNFVSQYRLIWWTKIKYILDTILFQTQGYNFAKILKLKIFHIFSLCTLSLEVSVTILLLLVKMSGFLNFCSSPTSQFWYRNWNLHTGMRNLILVSSSMFKCTYQLGLLFHHHSDAALQSKMEEPNISAAMLRSLLSDARIWSFLQTRFC